MVCRACLTRWKMSHLISRRMGNTTLREEVCVPVRVIEIDLSTKRALCSRFGNSPRWVSEREIKRYRVNKKVK